MVTIAFFPALNNQNVSLINDTNLGVKNLFADLGIFLIEK